MTFNKLPDETLLRYMDKADKNRPRTRCDCSKVTRPCPYVGCRYNMFLEINSMNGNIRPVWGENSEPDEMSPEGSCVLDIIEKHRVLTLEGISVYMNITRERIRQISDDAVRKLRRGFMT